MIRVSGFSRGVDTPGQWPRQPHPPDTPLLWATGFSDGVRGRLFCYTPGAAVSGFSESFAVILVFAFEDIWELGDIRRTAPSGRLVAMTHIAAQIE
jgi:hypothetical protein